MICCDAHRQVCAPAYEQLETLAKQVNCLFFGIKEKKRRQDSEGGAQGPQGPQGHNLRLQREEVEITPFQFPAKLCD